MMAIKENDIQIDGGRRNETYGTLAVALEGTIIVVFLCKENGKGSSLCCMVLSSRLDVQRQRVQSQKRSAWFEAAAIRQGYRVETVKTRRIERYDKHDAEI